MAMFRSIPCQTIYCIFPSGPATLILDSYSVGITGGILDSPQEEELGDGLSF